MKFGDNLYVLRKRRNMSQEKLAERVGVSRQSVSKWETGRGYPEMDHILKLCEIFHCKISQLIHENMADIDSLGEDIRMSVVKLQTEKQRRLKNMCKLISVLSGIARVILTVAIPLILSLGIFLAFVIPGVDVSDNGVNFDKYGLKIYFPQRTDDMLSIVIKGQVHTAGRDEVSREDYRAEQMFISFVNKVFTSHSKTTIIIFAEIIIAILCSGLYFIRRAMIHAKNLFDNIGAGDTPFTMENADHIRRIAYALIFSKVLMAVADEIANWLSGAGFGVSIGMMGLIQIVFLFAMAYIFEYGYEIQRDSVGVIYGQMEESQE